METKRNSFLKWFSGVAATVVSALIIWWATGGANSNKNDYPYEPEIEKEAKYEENNPIVNYGTVDRTDAYSTAAAILKAYRARDVVELSGYCLPENRAIMAEIASIGKSHPRYRSIFEGARMQLAQSWDGEISEVRYFQHFESVEAKAKFAISDVNEIAVVVMNWVDGKWYFEDINFPYISDFEKGQKMFIK